MIILYVLFLASLALAAVCASLRYMHYFQLDSYKFREHVSFLKRYIGPLCFLAIVSALVMLTSVFGGSAAGLIAAYIVSTFFVLIYFAAAKPKPKRSTKVPLRFTPRVLRMFVTIGLLTAVIVFLVTAFLPERLYFLFAGIYLLICPHLCMAASLVNSPIEAAIRAYYTRDAKRILRSHGTLRVVGITGSYGKTSTKSFLYTLLSEKYDVLMTPGNYNTPMGVVKTVREMLLPTHEIFVCEMGAKYAGDIKELCRLARPEFGIITSVGKQHLETFGSLEGVTKTKFELADYLGERGQLIVNYDNDVISAEVGRRALECVKVGSRGGNCRITDASADRHGTSFTLTFTDGESCRITAPVLGEHNVTNLSLAAAAAHELGMTPVEISRAAMRVKNPTHRLSLSQRGKDIFIDDAYNSNPAGAAAALDALSLFEGCRIIVTPGMVELGEESERLNAEFGEKAAKVCDYIFLVGHYRADAIMSGALGAGFPKEKICKYDRVGDAINAAFAVKSEKERVVLVENDLPDNY